MRKVKLTNLLEQYRYEFESWMKDFMSRPIEEIKHADYSQSYEIETGHLFKLENGKFAFVVESGCSCYDPSWAKPEIIENEVEALEKFAKWEVEAKKYAE